MTFRNVLIALALSTALGACSSGGNIRETLGLNRTAPDEFRVYARPPLTVPPDFNLRPPGSATGAPTALPAEAQARSALIGDVSVTSSAAVTPVTSKDLPNGADAQFLQNAGAKQADRSVRTLLQQDSANGVGDKSSSYLITPGKEGEPVVDPSKEAERLKQNKEQNKSPTAGDTPVVEPKSKGILGTIGDWF